MLEDEQRLLVKEDKDSRRDVTEQCDEEEKAQPSPQQPMTMPPPQTRPPRTTRKAKKRHRKGTSLSQSSSKTAEEHFAIQRTKTSSEPENPSNSRRHEKSVNDVVQRVTNTKTPVSRQDYHHQFNQPQTPVRSKSPLTPNLDVERPPRSPTSPDSCDSDKSRRGRNHRCRRPRRSSMSSLSAQSNEQPMVTVTQVSNRHRARRHNSLSFGSEENVLSNETRSKGIMLPATRPQRRRSVSSSRERDKASVVARTIDMNGNVFYTDGSNSRPQSNDSKTQRPRRHSINSTTMASKDASFGETSYDDKATMVKDSPSEVKTRNSNDFLDLGSFRVSPPKPKASRSLSMSKDTIKTKEEVNDYCLNIPAACPKKEPSSENQAEDRPKRERRFSLPRITKSLSASLRPIQSDGQAINDGKNRRSSQSPSITNLLHKNCDLSSRSSTERTASTVSTEHSNSSWEESPIVRSPSSKPNDSGPFGKILSRLKMESQQTPTPSYPPLLSPPSRNDQPPVIRSGRRPRETAPACSATTIDKHKGVNEEQPVVVTKTPKETQDGAQVCFGTVSIREYARSVSDNPSVGAGTPIGLDWAYSDPTIVPVDYFEKTFRKMGPRTRKDFYLTPEQRFHMLLDDWSCTMEQITDATRSAAHTKYLRQMSLSGALSHAETLHRLLPFDRRAPSRERTSLQNYRLPRAQNSGPLSPSKTALDV
ncbi:hypothetical protein IV203_008896 [Nitzschia inconspicua]|uniref:Uncharacterized protein n=1 Tax=Nitzschia inconspicua TaxID=303405 RepID=A0A9K3L0W1_9STRA|nr:hypothetical protein IV203_008896 [Nitzschia inconspicua]